MLWVPLGRASSRHRATTKLYWCGIEVRHNILADALSRVLRWICPWARPADVDRTNLISPRLMRLTSVLTWSCPNPTSQTRKLLVRSSFIRISKDAKLNSKLNRRITKSVTLSSRLSTTNISLPCQIHDCCPACRDESTSLPRPQLYRSGEAEVQTL